MNCNKDHYKLHLSKSPLPNKDYRNASCLFVANLGIIKHIDKDQFSHIFSALMTLVFSTVFWYTSKAHFVYCQKTLFEVYNED